MRLLWRLTKVSVVLMVVLLVLAVTIFSDTLVFYARVAKLYTQSPDARIAMPLEDVAKKEVADTWGAPRGVGRRHEGQDIFAPKGTPILSATNGYIYKIGENNLGGQTVSVIGSGGRVYYYAHLDSYARGDCSWRSRFETIGAWICRHNRKRAGHTSSSPLRNLHINRGYQSAPTPDGSCRADNYD